MKPILDNPIYNALNSAHRKYAKGTENVKYYEEDIASFAGLKNNSIEEFDILYQQSPKESTFVIFTPKPIHIPPQWKLLLQIDMLQMVYAHAEILTHKIIDLFELGEIHVPDMIALIELTQPGPFRSRTIVLGNYTGIFEGNDLIAMAGHRFNPTPYVEISAVCTHPAHLGKGHAFNLLNEQIKRILHRAEIPFLHVRNDNHGAIKLYRKLGFSIRTEMIAYVIQKVAD